MQFDTSGKVLLDHIYTQPDPRAYFATLRRLHYGIPQLAKPYFVKVIDEYRESQHVRTPRILDVGCSYGINAALLRCDMSMDELYERYCDGDVGTQSRGALLTVGTGELVRSRSRPAEPPVHRPRHLTGGALLRALSRVPR